MDSPRDLLQALLRLKECQDRPRARRAAVAGVRTWRECNTGLVWELPELAHVLIVAVGVCEPALSVLTGVCVIDIERADVERRRTYKHLPESGCKSSQVFDGVGAGSSSSDGCGSGRAGGIRHTYDAAAPNRRCWTCCAWRREQTREYVACRVPLAGRQAADLWAARVLVFRRLVAALYALEAGRRGGLEEL